MKSLRRSSWVGGKYSRRKRVSLKGRLSNGHWINLNQKRELREMIKKLLGGSKETSYEKRKEVEVQNKGKGQIMLELIIPVEEWGIHPWVRSSKSPAGLLSVWGTNRLCQGRRSLLRLANSKCQNACFQRWGPRWLDLSSWTTFLGGSIQWGREDGGGLPENGEGSTFLVPVDRWRRRVQDWEQFRELLVQKFRPIHEGTQCERFLAVRQSSTVDEFIKQFVELAAPLNELPDEVLDSVFMNGLNKEIKAELRVARPRNLDQMVTIAN